jgi:hypothetical protein
MPRLVTGVCAFVMFIITPSVKADPVVITSGQLFVVGISGSPSYIISGLNFSVTASGGDPGNTPSCLPCPSGTPISISSFLVGTSLGSGSATINGTTFNNIGFLGEFSFAVQPIVLPSDTFDHQIEVPFVFTGNIRGCSPSNVICTTEVFSTTQLTGQGIAKAAFTFAGIQNGVPVFNFTSVRYDFREIPEPVTITLLAGGLIGLGVRLRARRKIR